MRIISGQQIVIEETRSPTTGEIQFVDFPAGSVTSATAVIEGIDVEFSERNDHHLGRLRVNLRTTVEHGNPTTGPFNDVVNVFFDFGLRDWSGGSDADDLIGDDPINGTIRYSVITAP